MEYKDLEKNRRVQIEMQTNFFLKNGLAKLYIWIIILVSLVICDTNSKNGLAYDLWNFVLKRMRVFVKHGVGFLKRATCIGFQRYEEGPNLSLKSRAGSQSYKRNLI